MILFKKHTQLSVRDICDLFHLCLMTVYFVYDGVFYRQTQWSDRSPVSPVVTDIYMESKALQYFSGVTPRVWWRYADDTLMVILEGMRKELFNHINSVDEFLGFTEEPMTELKTIPKTNHR